MEKEAKCPICGAVLNVDYAESSYESNGRRVVPIIGFCEECDKDFTWDEIYTLVGVENICELDDN